MLPLNLVEKKSVLRMLVGIKKAKNLTLFKNYFCTGCPKSAVRECEQNFCKSSFIGVFTTKSQGMGCLKIFLSKVQKKHSRLNYNTPRKFGNLQTMYKEIRINNNKKNQEFNN